MVLNQGFQSTRVQTPNDKFLTYLSYYAIVDFGYITRRYLYNDLAYIDVRSVGSIDGVQVMYNHVELLCLGSAQGAFRSAAEPGDCVILFSPRFGFTDTQSKQQGSIGSYSTSAMKAFLVVNYAQPGCGIDMTRDGQIKEWTNNYAKVTGPSGNVQITAPNMNSLTQGDGAQQVNTDTRSSTVCDDGSYTATYTDVYTVNEDTDACSVSSYDAKRTVTIDSDGKYSEVHNDGNDDTYSKEIDNDGNITLQYSGTYSNTVTGTTSITLKDKATISTKDVDVSAGALSVSASSEDLDLGTAGTLKVGNSAATVADILNKIFSMLVQTGAGLTATGNASAQGAAITAAVQVAATSAKLLFPDVTTPAS